MRKFETIANEIVEEMPIIYDIEKDGLYLKGLEKGERKKELEATKSAIKLGLLTDEQIAQMLNVSIDFVKTVRANMQN